MAETEMNKIKKRLGENTSGARVSQQDWPEDQENQKGTG